MQFLAHFTHPTTKFKPLPVEALDLLDAYRTVREQVLEANRTKAKGIELLVIERYDLRKTA